MLFPGRALVDTFCFCLIINSLQSLCFDNSHQYYGRDDPENPPVTPPQIGNGGAPYKIHPFLETAPLQVEINALTEVTAGRPGETYGAALLCWLGVYV